MLMMLADAARVDDVKSDLVALGAPGYTVVPVAEGGGRTGVHAADRVHPGGLAMILVVDEDDRAGVYFDELVKRRAARADAVSKLFLIPVDRQA
jgi:nitrogen regulatory protein PII